MYPFLLKMWKQINFLNTFTIWCLLKKKEKVVRDSPMWFCISNFKSEIFGPKLLNLSMQLSCDLVMIIKLLAILILKLSFSVISGHSFTQLNRSEPKNLYAILTFTITIFVKHRPISTCLNRARTNQSRNPTKPSSLISAKIHSSDKAKSKNDFPEMPFWPWHSGLSFQPSFSDTSTRISSTLSCVLAKLPCLLRLVFLFTPFLRYMYKFSLCIIWIRIYLIIFWWILFFKWRL